MVTVTDWELMAYQVAIAARIVSVKVAGHDVDPVEGVLGRMPQRSLAVTGARVEDQLGFDRPQGAQRLPAVTRLRGAFGFGVRDRTASRRPDFADLRIASQISAVR